MSCDGTFAGRDDQAIAGGLEHVARRSLAVDDRGLVDDQPDRLLRVMRSRPPGRLRHGPRLHRAHEVMNRLGGLRPVDQPVFLAQLGSFGDLRSILRQDDDVACRQRGDALR